MKEQYQALLLRLLDAEPFKSTWYYQDEQLATIEQCVYETMMFDELFTAQDVWQRSLRKMPQLSLEKVQAQLAYMALADSEQRLIFHDVLLDMYATMTQRSSVDHLAECLRAIALETEDDGKIRRFLDEYIYLPKMLLLMLADDEKINYHDEQRRKLAAIKPKFAKYYFNNCLDMLRDAPLEPVLQPSAAIEASPLEQLLSIEAQAETEDNAKRKIYGRIK